MRMKKQIFTGTLIVGLILFLGVSICFAEGQKQISMTDQINQIVTSFKPVIESNKIVVKNEVRTEEVFLSNQEIIINLLSNAVATAGESSKIIITYDNKSQLSVHVLNTNTKYDVRKSIDLDGYKVEYVSKGGIGSNYSVNLSPVMCKI
jgi:ABC-type Zn uptake system ZnuABC Zn-binding protein ZnuA